MAIQLKDEVFKSDGDIFKAEFIKLSNGDVVWVMRNEANRVVDTGKNKNKEVIMKYLRRVYPR